MFHHVETLARTLGQAARRICKQHVCRLDRAYFQTGVGNRLARSREKCPESARKTVPDPVWKSEETAKRFPTPQKTKRTAICIVRGSLARLEIVPKVAAVATSLFGRPKFTVLNTLKMSQRSVTPVRPILICRWMVRSKFWKPGP